MIDLKEYSGKFVHIQFKPGVDWLLIVAGEKGFPDVKITKDKDGRVQPLVSPFIQGKVTSEGRIELDTEQGGRLEVGIAAELIGFVSTVTKTPETSMIVKP